MIVRCQLPWPLRATGLALLVTVGGVLGLAGYDALADLGPADGDTRGALAQARLEVARLQSERARLLSVANTADSLVKAERAAQERLAQQLKRIEAENLALKSDLGFFERLLPAAGGGVAIRGLQAHAREPGHTRFQLLVMQPGKSPPEFRGRYEITLTGTLDGKPWTFTPSGSVRPLQMKQYLRVEGTVEHPPEAVVKAVQVKVLDASGGVKATQAATV